LSPACRAMDSGHLLHSALTCPSSRNARHLKSKQPIVSPRNNSLVHLATTTDVRCFGRITHDSMRSGWRTLRCSVLRTFTTTSAPTLPEWLCQQKCGYDLTASAPVLDVSVPACTNGIWPLLLLLNVVQ